MILLRKTHVKYENMYSRFLRGQTGYSKGAHSRLYLLSRKLSSSTRSVIHLSLSKKEHKISAKMIQTFLRTSEVKIFSLPEIKIFLQTFPRTFSNYFKLRMYPLLTDGVDLCVRDVCSLFLKTVQNEAKMWLEKNKNKK